MGGCGSRKAKYEAVALVVAVAYVLFACAWPAFAQTCSATRPVSGGQARPLTFAERVKAQEEIERVYYAHRIWPKDNPGPKPPFNELMPRETLETKVRADLVRSEAFETKRGYSFSPEELDGELRRMQANTHDPAVLQELFEALGRNQVLLQECLARPTLVDRAGVEEENSAPVDLGHESFAAGTASPPSPLGAPDSWTATSTGANCPSGRFSHTSVWTGSEMIVWGGANPSILNTGGRYTPSTDSWTATSTGANCPSARYMHTAVWTGSEMIVWGGGDGAGGVFNTGGRYSPSTNSWTATSTGANCPLARWNHTAVWTGSEMIVWGGNGSSNFNTGGRYTPSTDTWTSTSTGANCPLGRYWQTAVWTGSVMIVWGGYGDSGYLNTGGRYTPSTDSWAATSTGANCPSAREWPTSAWTGSEMIVWGGTGGTAVNTGGRYSPSTDSWTSTSTGANCPSARYRHSAVWTGLAMIVWGGWNDATYFNTGGLYNPSADSWVATSTGVNCPSARRMHTGVRSGSEMIAWGGLDGASGVNTGGRYTPPCTTPGVPTIGTATVPGNNQITVSWTPGTPVGITYKIYRSNGACPGGTFSLVKSGQASSPWTDTTVSGGLTYSYKVTAVDTTGGCESAMSGCVSATATGPCILPPTFAGITGVTNPASATCTLNLAWGTATSNCAGTISYSVYRNQGSAPVPPTGLLASGLSGLTYSDSNSLTSGLAYYYIVRAVDSVSGQDANAVAMSGIPTGAIGAPANLLTENWDGVTAPALPAGWATAQASGTAGAWKTNAGTVHPTGGGTHSAPNLVYFNSYTAAAGNSTRLYRTVGVDLTNKLVASVTFWMYHDTGYTPCDDKVQVQYSTNGTIWNNAGSVVCRNDGSTGWKSHVVDLSAAIGNASVQLAFLGTSGYGNDCQIDDIALSATPVTACTTGSGPKPTPDGRVSGTAMKGSKVLADGSSLSITYDTATCSQADHAIIYGPGTALNPITASSGRCGIGNISPYSWSSGVPTVAAGQFIWFVVVGDAGTTESSWGQKYVGGSYSERTSFASNQCGNTAIDTTGTCP